jgi:hypothetical protein
MSKFKPFEDNQMNYELVNLNKVIYTKEEKGSSSKMHPVRQIGKNEASLLVAICPSYSFDFTQLSLVDQIPPISGKNLITLKKLAMQNHVILYVGIYELLTPLAFLRGISFTQIKQKLTFKQAKEDVEAKALEFETKFIDQESKSMGYIFSELLKNEMKPSVSKYFLLTSMVRKTPSFKKIQQEITKFYYDIDVPAEKKSDQLQYFDSANTCVGAVSQRIFKDFHAAQKGRKFYCIVKDEKSDELYDLQKFMFRLMVEHLLDEMALVLVAGQEYKIDYFVHYISRQGKSKENTEMERLLQMTKRLFLPEEYANKLFWQPIRFVERPQKAKEIKSNITSSELPVIPEVKSNLIPVPIKRTGSGSSSEETDSSSEEDKSPLLSTSPPKTFFTESDTVVLETDDYNVLYDMAISPEPRDDRIILLETIKNYNLEENNGYRPKDEIKLKASTFKFLYRMATSDWSVGKRAKVLSVYRQKKYLPEPSSPDLQFTRTYAVEVAKTQAPTTEPVPIPIPCKNSSLSNNKNGFFNKSQPKAPETQQLQSPPPRRRYPTPPSSPLENYGLYNNGYSQGYKWKPKESVSRPTGHHTRGRSLSASSND